MLTTQLFAPFAQRRRSLLWAVLPAFLTVLFGVFLLAGASRASALGQYGQAKRFGGFDMTAFEEKGLTSEHFLAPRGMAVDTQDSEGGTQQTAIYVLDRTSRHTGGTTTGWRIQKLDENGKALATTTFTLDNKEATAVAIEGLAVDHAAKRLYALVVGQGPAEEIVAQELIAWSTEPNAKQLVAPSGLGSDPLGSTGGLVSSKAQLQAKSTYLYWPQGIAIDPVSTAGSDRPVVIEASDLRHVESEESCNSTVRGDAVVQQVATSVGGSSKATGEVLEGWSSQSVSSQIGNHSCGPAGISLDPNGELTALLNDRADVPGPSIVVRLSADLKTATVLDKPPSFPNILDFDQQSFREIEPPFIPQPGQRVSQITGAAGAQVVQLSQTGSSTTDGLLASVFAGSGPEEDPQLGPSHSYYFYRGLPFVEYIEGTQFFFQGNIGVRLLQPTGVGQIADPEGRTIVNTLGNAVVGGACSLTGGAVVALTAGNNGALWVLVDGPPVEDIEEEGKKNGPSHTALGREVVEFVPGAGAACPQSSGTFTMQAPGGSAQAGDTQLEVPLGTTVKFDAGGLHTEGGVPFAYEWQLDNEDPTHGMPVNAIAGPSYSVPPATAEYTYTKEGTYNVKLTLRSDYGTYTTDEGTVVVTKPTGSLAASFVTEPASPVVGTEVRFNGANSTAGAGTITNYEWTFGDGAKVSGPSLVTVGHTYTQARVYVATLVVTNSLGQKSSAFFAEVKIEEPTSKGGGSPPPPPPGEESPLVDKSKTKVSPAVHEAASDNGITVNLTCPATKISCSGTIKVETVNAIVAAKHAKPKRVVLAQGSFSLKPGQHESLSLRFSAAAVKLLQKLKHLSAVVTVIATDSFGDASMTKLKIGLSAAAKKKTRRKH